LAARKLFVSGENLCLQAYSCWVIKKMVVVEAVHTDPYNSYVVRLLTDYVEAAAEVAVVAE
jgi:hypothetical protein